ncbi:hypothetical protein BJY24_007899 [Nocardia transvalensis]|uniref:Uncharacterized protein n=1 Tax=Nocardia transvalensis TaxID=37333 RepID=A0A7W9PMU2_9NOCA|nr:hypothetical protein [Nocardia transvalensis]MBB5918966.1 hypothetical protein [Nocardia transvalensis]
MPLQDSLPPIEQATTYTAVIGSDPVLIVLPRMRSVHIAPSGELAAADAWTAAVTAHGAMPMTDAEFAHQVTPGWLVTIAKAMTTATIAGPPGLGEIYTGALEADRRWRQLVEQLHQDGGGLVVITGTADRMEPEAALEMMEAERAVWVRARTTLR